VIESLKQTIQKQKATIADKSGELEGLSRAHSSDIAKLANQGKAERQNLIDSYEKALSEVSQQCESLRRDLQQLSENLSSEVAKYRKLKRQQATLQAEKMKLERDLSATAERSERDRKLHEATLQSASVTLAANCQQKAAELRSECERDKRRIFAFVAEVFRDFCDVSQSLDERAFRALLSRVKDEFSRMAESETTVRRILGGSPSEPIEDLIQAMILNHPPVSA
jgi:chromosome segregation ATPase